MGRYKPFFDVIFEKMSGEEQFLPTHLGHYTNKYNAIIARGSMDFVNLFGSKQLDELLGKKDCQWLNTAINEKNEKIWHFFTTEKYLNIDIIRPEKFIEKISKQFIEKQSDEWVTKLYIFLFGQPSIVKKIKQMPFIRIIKPKKECEDIIVDHMAPFDLKGEPQVFLPIENDKNNQINKCFPIVKETIISDDNVRSFLKDLGLAQPDEFAAIKQVFLKGFHENTSVISDKEYEWWLVKIIGFLINNQNDINYGERIEKLKERMLNTPFLYTNNCEGQTELKNPNTIYQSHHYSGSKDLELFFEGNPDIWFLDPRYQNITDFSILIDFLGISDRPKIFTEPFKNYHRYKKGFTHDYVMDGLEYFLKNNSMTLDKSLYLYKLLLQSQTDPKYQIKLSGTLNYANDMNYTGAVVGSEEKNSTIFKLVTSHAWIPNKSSGFERPSEVTEFHEEFEKLSKDWEQEYNILHKKLKFQSSSKFYQNVIDNLLENLEPGAELLEKWKIVSQLSMDVILKAQKIQEEEKNKAQQITETVQDEVHPQDELRKFFDRPGIKEQKDLHHEDNPISDPDRRREIIAEEIQETQKSEPKSSDRISYSLRKKWDGKNPETRAFLLHEYGGKCQVCSSSFNKKDGDPYFEGLYLIPYIKGAWLDREGNVLCLCPNCCAKMLHGSVKYDGDIVEFILEYKIEDIDDSKKRDFKITLCGGEETIKFSNRHIMDLQEILRLDSKNP